MPIVQWRITIRLGVLNFLKNKFFSSKVVDILLLSFFTALIISSCFLSFSKPKENGGKNCFYVQTYDERPVVENIDRIVPVKKIFPVAGTVSHHFLTDRYIDSWFLELKNLREVKNIFIISPSHYQKEKTYVSLATGKWLLPDGSSICSNDVIVNEILSTMEQTEDRDVFINEHGINTLIPYIIHYFPDAKIVPIVVIGEPPLNLIETKKITAALKPFFTGRKASDNFLLVSTDFSHHQNLETTLDRDKKSKIFFDNPSADNYRYAICDNRPSIYVLEKLFSRTIRSSVLYNTNSYLLSGKDEDDITSYFFSFFYFE